MATGANRVLEGDVLFSPVSVSLERSSCSTYRSRIDSNTVVLVIAFGPGDSDTGTLPDVEAVRVVAQLISVAGRVVDGHVGDGQVLAAVDADSLNRGVLDVQVGDGGGLEVVGLILFQVSICHKELWGLEGTNLT